MEVGRTWSRLTTDRKMTPPKRSAGRCSSTHLLAGAAEALPQQHRTRRWQAPYLDVIHQYACAAQSAMAVSGPQHAH